MWDREISIHDDCDIADTIYDRRMKKLPRTETASQRRIRLKVIKGHCTWCQKRVGKGRRTWCNKNCYTQFRLVNDVGFIRKQLYKRDKGICQLCKVDTNDPSLLALKASINRLQREAGLCLLWYKKQKPAGYWWKRRMRSCTCFFCMLYKQIDAITTWQADHIIPVSKGGGQCGLDGFRTLCVVCHKKETAKLRGSDAK